jgi:serine/threonine protein phosphatase 1
MFDVQGAAGPNSRAIEVRRMRNYLDSFAILGPFMPVKRLLRYVSGRQAPESRLPEGRRVYAVGDIHGRRDLLDDILARIEDDAAARGAADTLIVFLGDLIDRGPDSRGVVERLIAFAGGPFETRFLMGNHEEVFLRALSGDLKALRFLIRIGGRETILSYGLADAEYRALDFESLLETLRARVPDRHVDFLSGFERWVEAGDYLFVHAGIRPGVPLDAQDDEDLIWIRAPFLNHRFSGEVTIVHGHTPVEAVEPLPGRIDIDTGCFYSGVLTAVRVLPTGHIKLLQARGAPSDYIPASQRL